MNNIFKYRRMGLWAAMSIISLVFMTAAQAEAYGGADHAESFTAFQALEKSIDRSPGNVAFRKQGNEAS